MKQTSVHFVKDWISLANPAWLWDSCGTNKRRNWGRSRFPPKFIEIIIIVTRAIMTMLKCGFLCRWERWGLWEFLSWTQKCNTSNDDDDTTWFFPLHMKKLRAIIVIIFIVTVIIIIILMYSFVDEKIEYRENDNRYKAHHKEVAHLKKSEI